MITITYDIECLYKATEYKPEYWEVWASNHNLPKALEILREGIERTNDELCLFKSCRIVRVNRELI